MAGRKNRSAVSDGSGSFPQTELNTAGVGENKVVAPMLPRSFVDLAACAGDRKLDESGLRSFINGSEGMKGSRAAELIQEQLRKNLAGRRRSQQTSEIVNVLRRSHSDGINKHLSSKEPPSDLQPGSKTRLCFRGGGVR